MSKRIYLGILVAFLFSSVLLAQSDSVMVKVPGISDEKTVDPEQNEKWRMGQYEYSAKPKNAWELGIHLGHFMITGDVDANLFGGFGIGLSLRKALSYTFSLRGDFTYGSTGSKDARPTGYGVLAQERVFKQNGGVNGPLSAYEGSLFHRNYKTKYIGFSLEGILNLGNILFHSPSNKWNFYGVAGIGLYSPNVDVDLLNGNSAYNFGSVTSGLDLTTKGDRKEARSRLGDLLDGEYETEGGVENTVFAFGDDKSLLLHFDVALGIARKISKRVNIGLEHKLIISDNDLLDSWEYRTNLDETNNLDLIHYTSLRLNINLGNFDNRTEPLYWLNPLDAVFDNILIARHEPGLDLSDDDNDGVINLIDMELNTPAGSPVDTRGVALDSDGDNILDYVDAEPYSPPGFVINEEGVAQVPKHIHMTKDSVISILMENCKDCVPSECGEWFLPMIHFDLDKYSIKPEFYSHLHHVATVLKECPNICVVAQGHTDVRHSNDYNNVLSYNRAKEAVDYLVENYSIDRSRLKIMYGGEGSPLIQNLPEYGGSANDEKKQYMNRRVEFRLCKASDYDMPKPEGPDAGTGERRVTGNKNSGY